jgi:hypothetical protein
MSQVTQGGLLHHYEVSFNNPAACVHVFMWSLAQSHLNLKALRPQWFGLRQHKRCGAGLFLGTQSVMQLMPKVQK